MNLPDAVISNQNIMKKSGNYFAEIKINYICSIPAIYQVSNPIRNGEIRFVWQDLFLTNPFWLLLVTLLLSKSLQIESFIDSGTFLGIDITLTSLQLPEFHGASF